MVDTDWGYQLAEQVVAALAECGACDAVEIVDWGGTPSGCGDGDSCGCSLSVAVLEGLAADPGDPCSLWRTARVELVLDVCRTYPERDGFVDPLPARGLVRDHAALRWQILAAMRGAAAGGRLGAVAVAPGVGLGCGSWSPGEWEWVAEVGRCARYRTVWRFRSGIV